MQMETRSLAADAAGERPRDCAFEHAIEAALVIDPLGDRILSVNPSCCRLLGYDRAALEGASVTGLHPGQFSALLVFTDAVMTLGRKWTRALTPSQALGATLNLEYAGVRLPDENGRPTLLLTLTDLDARYRRDVDASADDFLRSGVAEWQRVERLFQDIERQNQLILRAAGDGIFGVNAEGKTTFLNPAGARLLGWQPEEIIGRGMHETVHHHHADGSCYLPEDCLIYAAFRDGAVHTVREEVFWHRDGTPIWVEYTSTPVRDRGVLVGAVIIFRDIAARRAADAELKAALAEVDRLRADLELENAFLKEEIRQNGQHRGIIGDSLAIQRTLRQVEAVAPTNATVLISGESGTGKELVAHAIHAASMGASRPLVRVNCASVSREQFESDYFGHLKNAFPGAVKDRIGRFEMAHGGTIFLDEVAELPLDLQGKIMSLVQDGQFERLGDDRTRNVSVRIIASTNRDLAAEVRKGRFRQDLYFRLNVFPIDMPPLRDHREDIPMLAMKFLREAAQKLHYGELRLSEANLRRLSAYHWPGNVRELQNVIERAAILSGGGRLAIDLPDSGVTPSRKAVPPRPYVSGMIETEADRRQRERANIEAALAAAGGKVSGPGGAADRLGIKVTTLSSRMKAMGISGRGR
jgi:formate hydrogenlyase transcriptional activator